MRYGLLWERRTVAERYRSPPPDFPYQVSGTHPTIGYVEFGVTSRENAEQSAEALRRQGYQDINVQDLVNGRPADPTSARAFRPI